MNSGSAAFAIDNAEFAVDCAFDAAVDAAFAVVCAVDAAVVCTDPRRVC